ncbi:MAG: coproporphyrinogen dehydrogenase HemZ [Clostridia bacterium]
MVGIITNRPEYRNDIAEEIRLFLGLSEIELMSDSQPIADLIIDLQLLHTENGSYTLQGCVGSSTVSSEFTIVSHAPLEIKKHEKRQLKLATYQLLRMLYPDIETPWGSLTGIRPTKLFREIARTGGVLEAQRQFSEIFAVSPGKIRLASEICRVQKPTLGSVQSKDIDIYIGIPFCRTRCLYCSFASEVLRSPALLTDYLVALKADIANGAKIVQDGGYRVRAMYVGGGTPTVLTAAQLNDLMTFALDAYGGFGLECTVEAGRPDTIDAEKLQILRSHGVERVSINPQTMNDRTLRCIGRAHTVAETIEAFYQARTAGFSSINMDVIAGLPGESIADMAYTYAEIEKLQPDNLTVHALAIKRSSQLKKQLNEYPLPTPEEAERMIADGYALATRMGMQPYYMYRQKYMSGNLENVGYARSDKICVYNIDMMEETVSILSHGAGSMTKRVFDGENRIERLPSPKDVPTYLTKLPQLCAEKQRFFLD